MPTSKVPTSCEARRHYLQRNKGFFKAEVYITRLANGESVVCKDYSRFSGHWNAPLARWLARRELRLLERLQEWPHSPRAYPYEAPTDASSKPSVDASMIVQMEYIPGELLVHQPHEQSALIYKKLFCALRELHRMGIVHNDIRGTNIMLRNGTPVFIDFTSACSLPQFLGLAKLTRLLKLFDLRHLIKVKHNLGLRLSQREARLRKRSNGTQGVLNIWKKGLLPHLKHQK